MLITRHAFIQIIYKKISFKNDATLFRLVKDKCYLKSADTAQMVER